MQPRLEPPNQPGEREHEKSLIACIHFNHAGHRPLGALAALALAPVLAVGGVVKASNNHEVTKEIRRRHTDLPVDIDAGDQLALDLFFPLAPSPQRVELTYVDGQGEHIIVIDTRESLDGLHIPARKGANEVD